MATAKVWTKDEFLATLIPEGDCLLWPGATNASGYGQARHEGKTWLASRLAYHLTKGPIPQGMYVCHNCPGGDNPTCCNPTHLWIGTPYENWLDMVGKGRGQSIEQIAKRKPRGKARIKRVKLSPIPYGPPKPVIVYLPSPVSSSSAVEIDALSEALEWARSWRPFLRTTPNDRLQLDRLTALADTVLKANTDPLV